MVNGCFEKSCRYGRQWALSTWCIWSSKKKILKTTFEGDGIFSDVFEKVTRQKFKGEKHIPLYTEEGFRVANFAGPSTAIETRLKSDDPKISQPVTLTDQVAKTHDIRYSLAENFDDIKFADEKMISKLQEIERYGLDYKVNTQVAKNAIKLKRFFEDISNIKGTFSGLTKDGKRQKQLNDDEKRLYKNALLKLEQHGFGLMKKNKKLPDKPLTDHYINDYLKHSKSFIGAMPKDKLKNVKINKKKSMSCIVNLDDSKGPGTHWVCCYYKPKLSYSFFFDSFGLKPPKDVVKFLKRFNKPIYYNDVNIQSLDSVRCGHYCLDVIGFLDKGYNPEQILRSYTKGPSEWNGSKALDPNF